MKKKITAVVGAALMLTMSVGAFSSCKWFKKDADEGQKTVMNICLNPEVEFVLDGNNKVVYGKKVGRKYTKRKAYGTK